MRRVLQQRERMNFSLVEREGVDQRLQGRARRPRPARSVDLAMNFGVRTIGRADLRQDLHCFEIDEERRGVHDSAVAALRDVIVHPLLQHLLE